jgi:hypothetical protein
MGQNISFEGGGIKVSESLIARTINAIFPGTNYLDTLILIFCWFLVGIITLGIFFYFSKKRKMFKTMSLFEKAIFSLLFGFGSFMTVIFTYIPFALLKLDPLDFFNGGRILPFMILAAFLLYGCLMAASRKQNGRPFLIGTYKFLEVFFILISVTVMAVCLFIKTRQYQLLLWIIVDFIYIKQRFIPFIRHSHNVKSRRN